MYNNSYNFDLTIFNVECAIFNWFDSFISIFNFVQQRYVLKQLKYFFNFPAVWNDVGSPRKTYRPPRIGDIPR